VTLKGQTRDPNTLIRAQYLENGWRLRLRSKGPPVGNGRESNGHVTDDRMTSRGPEGQVVTRVR